MVVVMVNEAGFHTVARVKALVIPVESRIRVISCRWHVDLVKYFRAILSQLGCFKLLQLAYIFTGLDG